MRDKCRLRGSASILSSVRAFSTSARNRQLRLNFIALLTRCQRKELPQGRDHRKILSWERAKRFVENRNRGQACDCAIPSALSNQKFPFADQPLLTQSRCIGTPSLPEQIELHRDRRWRRDEDLRVESAASAERFIEDVDVAGRGQAYFPFI
jgi:hypothetical protein